MINLEALKNIILNVVNKYTVRNQNGSRKQVIGQLEFHRNRLLFNVVSTLQSCSNVEKTFFKRSVLILYAGLPLTA